MPWEFEGDKNPLRFKTKRYDDCPTVFRASKDAPKLDPKLHRLVLSPMETMLAVAVLGETVQKLNFFLAKVPPTHPNFEFRDIKMKAVEPATNEIETDEYKLIQIKVSTHMMNMKTLLNITRDELLLNEEPAGLNFYNDLNYWVLHEEAGISEAHQFVSRRVSKVKQGLREAQEMSSASTHNLKSGLATAEAGFEEACSLTTVIQEYTKKFQKARIEQNRLKINKVEAEHKRELYSRLKAIQDEHSANQLIVRYLNQVTEELEKKLTCWSKKYDSDIEEIELKMATYDQEVPDLVFDLAQILTSYYSRELEINQYVRWRDWHLKVKDIEIFLEFFAGIIQAWWRGTMVRWEIGPYAPKKTRRKQLTPPSPSMTHDTDMSDLT